MKNNMHKSFTTETMILFFIFCLLICLVSSGCKPEEPEGPVYNIALYNDIYGDDGSAIWASLGANPKYDSGEGCSFHGNAYSGQYSICDQVDDCYLCINSMLVGDREWYHNYKCLFDSFSPGNICSSDAILILHLKGSNIALKLVCVDSCEETVSEGIDINLFEPSSEIIIDLDNYEED